MSVTGVSSSPYLKDIPTRLPQKEMDKDAFLKLMLAQMQNQDPSQPLDNNEYIAQMSQFSSLEQLTNLNKTFTTIQAFQLVGQNVKATVPGTTIGTTKEIEGVVDRVKIDGGNVFLMVGASEIKLADVSEVFTKNGGTV